jgi:hypothetical protein
MKIENNNSYLSLKIKNVKFKKMKKYFNDIKKYFNGIKKFLILFILNYKKSLCPKINFK